MTIDFWGLGLQAVNVLILVWILSRVFWRPVAAAITRRQEAAQKMIGSAQAMREKADEAYAEVTEARANIKAERVALLETAKAEAEASAKATLANAQARAEEMRKAAEESIHKQTLSAQKAHAAHASELSLKIAGKLLEHLNGPTAQSAFLAQLVDAITRMSDVDRAALLSSQSTIEVVAPENIGTDRDAIVKAIHKALGAEPELEFVADPALIGGLELRSTHFVLRNSWQADLTQVQKAVTDAA